MVWLIKIGEQIMKKHGGSDSPSSPPPLSSSPPPESASEAFVPVVAQVEAFGLVEEATLLDFKDLFLGGLGNDFQGFRCS
jgi:hypothetical protein